MGGNPLCVSAFLISSVNRTEDSGLGRRSPEGARSRSRDPIRDDNNK